MSMNGLVCAITAASNCLFIAQSGSVVTPWMAQPSHLQPSFTLTLCSNGRHSLPQHLGIPPEPLLISQTNYSRFTTPQPPLTNGQLTDPHTASHPLSSVWGFQRARLRPLLRFISRTFYRARRFSQPDLKSACFFFL